MSIGESKQHALRLHPLPHGGEVNITTAQLSGCGKATATERRAGATAAESTAGPPSWKPEEGAENGTRAKGRWRTHPASKMVGPRLKHPPHIHRRCSTQPAALVSRGVL